MLFMVEAMGAGLGPRLVNRNTSCAVADGQMKNFYFRLTQGKLVAQA